MSVNYCPDCGNELDTKPLDRDGGWGECPEHGRVHIEYYEP